MIISRRFREILSSHIISCSEWHVGSGMSWTKTPIAIISLREELFGLRRAPINSASIFYANAFKWVTMD